MWSARCIGARNALIASPAFQRMALRFPLTRLIARRHARRLFDLVAGFTYTQTLLACVELDLFSRLCEGPIHIESLARTVGLSVTAMRRLAEAATAIGLLHQLGDGRIALGVLGAALVGNPGVAAMIAHHRHLYSDLADPLGVLRSPGRGGLAAFWDYNRGDESGAVADYSALMAASLPPVATQLLDAYDVRRHRRLLEIGGGEGVFLSKVHERAPRVQLGLFDLPAVIERARPRLGDMVKLHPDDFRSGPLPEGYDCIALVRVLHDHGDDIALALLGAIRRALPSGGTLLIAEPMQGARGAEPVGATYFGWYLLAMGSGCARTPKQIGSLIDNAGFRRWSKLRTRLPLVASAIVARA